MSRKFAKRALSLLISLALIISLLPSVVFATEESGVATDIVLNFNSSTITDNGGADDATPKDGQNFKIVTGEGKTTGAEFAVYDKFIRVAGYMGTGQYSHYNWLGNSDGTRGRFTVSTDVPNGIYEIKVQGALLNIAAMMYVYVNGEYVGIYNGYSSEYTAYSSAELGEEISLGKVKIEHDPEEVDQSVEIQFFNAAVSKGANGTYSGETLIDYNTGSNMLISKVTLHPIDELPTVTEIECEIPDSVTLNENFTIAPKVKLSDGTYKAINGYTATKQVDESNNIAAEVSWNSSVLSNQVLWNPKDSYAMYETNGEYMAKLTGVEAGEADVKVTAVVDGKTYTYKKTVWVIDPDNPPREFTLKIAGNGVEKGSNKHSTVNAYVIDNTWTWNGFKINEEKSEIEKSYGSVIKASAAANQTNKAFANIRLNVGAVTWPTEDKKIVFQKNVPVEGWYKVKVDGMLARRGGVFAIYANGEYIGTYDFHKETTEGDADYEYYFDGDEKELNTVYLPKGEVDISFCAVEIPVSDPAMYLDAMTFTAWQPEDADAENIDDKISYIVRADERANDSNVMVSDSKYTVNGTNVGEWTVGESFTATATGDDFAYWANGSGAPVSTDAKYTFEPTSNFTLVAVYAPADATTKKVQFWNYNKVFLDEVTATENTLGNAMPSNPSLNGWSFTGWKTDANTEFDANTAITEAITRVVAQFTKQDKPFTIGEMTYDYDGDFSKTAADTDGEIAFSYWTIDGQVASYDPTLSFNVWDSVDVVAVYEGTKTAVPTVVLDKVSADEYFILYEVPEGYTAVDAGIVFGSNEPRVDSTDGSKASVKKAGAKGQFTAAPHKDADENIKARGYVMYKDKADNLRILYTAAQ